MTLTSVEIISLLIGISGLLFSIIAIVLVYKVRIFDVEKIVSEIHLRLSGMTQDAASIREAMQNVTPFVESLKSQSSIIENIFHLPMAKWEFAQKIYKNRVDKALICNHIVKKCLKPNTRLLLDSGSTVDLVLAELLNSDYDRMTVYSNNIFAAMHLVGAKKITFHVLGGLFNEPYAACYSDKANNEIEILDLDVFIMAASAFSYDKGILVHAHNLSGIAFKTAALRAFQNNSKSRLVIAFDASKLVEDLDKVKELEIPWLNLLSEHKERITIVTSKVSKIPVASLRNQAQQEIDRLLEAGCDLRECSYEKKSINW